MFFTGNNWKQLETDIIFFGNRLETDIDIKRLFCFHFVSILFPVFLKLNSFNCFHYSKKIGGGWQKC